MADNHLISSGAILLTGGRDGMGRPLVTFEPSQHASVSTSIMAAAAVQEVLRSIPGSPSGAAFLANFRAYNRESMTIVIDALDKIQSDHRGLVGALYAVLPKSRENQKQLKKLLGLKTSRKNPKVPAYQCVLVPECKDLSKHIDMSQVTREFGGSLLYDHAAWSTFTKRHDAFKAEVDSVLSHVPAALDRLSMLLEYDIPTDPAQAQELLATVRHRYNDVMRDLNLEHTIDECKEHLEEIKSPTNGHESLPPLLLQAARRNLETREKKMITQRQELKLLWQQAEARILKKTKVQKYKGKAEKVLQWIKDVGMPGVNEDPEIADCLSKAEIFKNHFETGFYAIAKNVVWLSRKIQNKLDDLVMENKANIPDLLKFSRHFQSTVDYFKKAVDKKYQVYVNVHSFYLTSQKGIDASELEDVTLASGLSLYSYLEQMTQWYQRALRFIPVQLLHQQTTLQQDGRPVVVARPTKAWRSAVDNFILHHPMPKMSHLNKLKNVLPVIDDLVVRNQARLLIHRIEVICKLLANTDGMPIGVIREMLRWRDQVAAGADDITLHAHGSTLDLANLRQFESDFPSISLGSISHLSHASSTKSLHNGAKFALHEIPDYDDDDAPMIQEETDGRFQTMERRARSPARKTAHFRDQSLPRHKSGTSVTTAPRERSLPRSTTLDRSNKLRSRSEHNLHYDMSSALLASSKPAKETPQKPVVPKLDLSFIHTKPDKKPLVKVVSPKMAAEEVEDYGIYGNSDEEDELATSPQERYVSLDVPDASSLPQTLKHVDLNALKENRTQEKVQRISSRDSVTDSGITHTRTGTDASALSLNTLGLSPLAFEAAGPELHAKETDPNPLLLSKSLPDLNYKASGELDLTQQNIDAIVNSALSEEEKLDLMAVMCENKDIETSKLSDKTHELLYRFSDDQTDTERDSQHSDQKNHVLSHESDKEKSERSITPSGKVNPRKPRTSAGEKSDAKVQGLSDQSRAKTQQAGYQSKPRSQTSDQSNSRIHKSDQSQQRMKGTDQLQSKTDQSGAKMRSHDQPTASTSLDDQTVNGRKKKQDYGIDVAAWVNKYGYEADSIEAESVGLSSVEINSTDGMEEYVAKLKTAHQDRKAEELDLEKERKRLSELELEGEVLCQDDVERSLKRTHTMLQEQEQLLQDEDRRPETVNQDGRPVRDDCSAASEESGIFTQTSNDSRFRFSESGGELRMRMMLQNDANRSYKRTNSAGSNTKSPHRTSKSGVKTPSNKGLDSKGLNSKASKLTQDQKLGYHVKDLSKTLPAKTEESTTSKDRPLDVRPKTSASVRQADFRDRLSKRIDDLLKSPTKEIDVEKPKIAVASGTSIKFKDEGFQSPTEEVAKPFMSKTDSKKSQAREKPVRASAKSSRELSFQSKSSSFESQGSASNGKATCNFEDGVSKVAVCSVSSKNSACGGGGVVSEDESIRITGLDSESEMLSHDEDCDETRHVPLNQTLSSIEDIENGEASLNASLLSCNSVAAIENESDSSSDGSDTPRANGDENLHGRDDGTNTPKMECLSDGEMYYESEESDYKSDDNDDVVRRGDDKERGPSLNPERGDNDNVIRRVDDKDDGRSLTPESDEDEDVIKRVENKGSARSLDPESEDDEGSVFDSTMPLDPEAIGENSLSESGEKNVQVATRKATRKASNAVEDNVNKFVEENASEYIGDSASEFVEDNVSEFVEEDDSEFVEENVSEFVDENVSESVEENISEVGSVTDVQDNPEQNNKNLQQPADHRAKRHPQSGSDLETSDCVESYVSDSESAQNDLEELQNIRTKPALSRFKSLSNLEDSQIVNGSNNEKVKEGELAPKFQERGIDVDHFVKNPIKAQLKSKSSFQLNRLQDETDTENDNEVAEINNVKPKKKSFFRFFKKKSSKKDKPKENSIKEVSQKVSMEQNASSHNNKAIQRRFSYGSDFESTLNSDVEVEKPRHGSSRFYSSQKPFVMSKIKEAKMKKPPRRKLPSDSFNGGGGVEGVEVRREIEHREIEISQNDEVRERDSRKSVSTEKSSLNHKTQDATDGTTHSVNGSAKFRKSTSKIEKPPRKKIPKLNVDSAKRDEGSNHDKIGLNLETNNKRRGSKLLNEKVETVDNYNMKADITDSVTQHVRSTHGMETRCDDSSTHGIPIPTCYTTEMLNLKTPVIIDNGSGLCKCGLASNDYPTSVFPNLIGRPKYEEAMAGNVYKDVYVGQDVQRHRGMLKVTYPVEHGIVQDWDDMELLWDHALSTELRVDPSDHPILLTEAPLNPVRNRERMAEVLFESLSAPAVYVAVQAVLALYGAGRTTGCVVDIGDGVTHVVPVYEGHSLPHATHRMDLAGRDLTHYLAKLLQEDGSNFTTSAEMEIVKEMKEQHCYVAENFYDESLKAATSIDLEQYYGMPDGNKVSLNSQRFRCGEVLFQPSLVGREDVGIQNIVQKTVNKCDIDIRKSLLQNIILSGGTTMLPGLAERLEAELHPLHPGASASAINVSSSQDRKYLVWQGGAALANTPAFSASWFFRQDYEEYGLNLLHKICF